MTHKVLECLANCKLCEQNGEPGYTDNICGEILASDMWDQPFIDKLTRLAFDYFKQERPNDFDESNFREVNRWVYKELALNNGLYDPRKRNIVNVEGFFDYEIPDSWATTQYGQLKIRGTIDLITKLNENTHELIDYKSGKRMSWSTGNEKDYQSLADDPQMRFYHMSLSLVYPHIKYFILTLVYINDGGAFSVTFSEKDLDKTKEILRKFYEDVKGCVSPTLKESGNHWFCKRVCGYHKEKFINTDDSICSFIYKQIKKIGIEETIKKYRNNNFSINSYQEPGR